MRTVDTPAERVATTAEQAHARADEAPTSPTPDRTATRELIDGIIAQFGSSMRHVRCASAERLVRQGVSMTHLHVLWQLQEHGELGMSRVADLIGVSMSNATGLIDRMEERGLVDRVRLTDDRRAVHVRPTAHGLDILREMDVVRSDLVAAVLGRLDDEQLGRLARSITDIRDALQAEQSAAGASPTTCDHEPAPAGRAATRETIAR
jgi:DNA-binding MarR family transcriptional regulator